MGDLRLYAIGLDEVRAMFGASPPYAAQLTEIAAAAAAPAAPPGGRSGLLNKLGPLFRRTPTLIVDPEDPDRADLDRLLGGDFVPPERLVPTWRLLERLIAGHSWGALTVPLEPRALDDLDFALARGGVSAAVGIRHLLGNSPHLQLTPVTGLAFGYHPHQAVTGMAAAYRHALPEVPGEERQELVGRLATWLEGFPAWAEVAPSLQRPQPDLVAFWATG